MKQIISSTWARLASAPLILKIGLPAAVIALAVLGSTYLGPSGEDAEEDTLYTVRPMDLTISILEGGTLESSKSLDYPCEVEGRTTVISIIPEGTIITPEDVANKRVLVELDSSELRERASQQDVTVQSSLASYTQAKESFEIQKNQNESNIKRGELDRRFARMDLEKYLGVDLALDVINDKVEMAGLQLADLDSAEVKDRLEVIGLGGEALQRWKKLQADIELAGEDVKQAEVKYNWTKELGPKESGGKGYLSREELERDELSLTRSKLNLDQARMALDLFLRYEFLKEAEKRLSDSQEAERELERINAKARAELAQAEAQLKSREGTYNLQKERLDKLNHQIENCTIVATKPGMVVYPMPRRRSETVIEAGSEVRERQVLLQIPDSQSMNVNVKVHEAAVNQVKPGLRVKVVVDGFPDRVLWGSVQKVALLPDQSRWWMSNVKVYNTVVLLEKTPADLRPGMSAQVEIIVDQLKDALALPIQAVTTDEDGNRVCYVMNSSEPAKRVMETGLFNDNFIEVLSGVREGDRVMLRPPITAHSAVARMPIAEEEDNSSGETLPSSETLDVASPPQAPPADDSTQGEAAGQAAGVDIEAFLSQLPEEVRERARERLANLSEEELRTEIERMKSRGGRRGGGRPRQATDMAGTVKAPTKAAPEK